MKKILFLITVLCVLFIVGCNNEQPKGGSVAKADIILVVEEKREIFPVEFTQDTTLMEVMKANFEIETAFEDTFIVGINGIVADDEAKVGWMYYVNGEFATKGANDFKPKDGDSIEFKYESWE